MDDKNLNLFKYISTDVLEDRVYFQYGGFGTEAEVFLSWRNLTAYYTTIKFNNSPDSIYFIESKNFFGGIDDFVLEFHFEGKIRSEEHTSELQSH